MAIVALPTKNKLHPYNGQLSGNLLICRKPADPTTAVIPLFEVSTFVLNPTAIYLYNGDTLPSTATATADATTNNKHANFPVSVCWPHKFQLDSVKTSEAKLHYSQL